MKKKLTVAFSIVLIVMLIVGSVLGVKVYKHEKWQSGQIHNLSAQVRELQETNDSLVEQISNEGVYYGNAKRRP